MGIVEGAFHLRFEVGARVFYGKEARSRLAQVKFEGEALLGFAFREPCGGVQCAFGLLQALMDLVDPAGCVRMLTLRVRAQAFAMFSLPALAENGEAVSEVRHAGGVEFAKTAHRRRDSVARQKHTQSVTMQELESRVGLAQFRPETPYPEVGFPFIGVVQENDGPLAELR
ncbi:hypothetical protein [Caballeronia sp. AZ1_KS37]|uniref:hypothetical protein n=1 Tax=Caballeronia sp. AZ1_KS37 TaxID=2921756 RepID=UPI00202988E4|nr:hypothetical protein [Caballeronia sp. AZ1_KS37]